MAEIKPLGSEKLNSDDKLKRILELTYFNNNKKNSTSNNRNIDGRSSEDSDSFESSRSQSSFV